jgi:hypothetical protein
MDIVLEKESTDYMNNRFDTDAEGSGDRDCDRGRACSQLEPAAS